MDIHRWYDSMHKWPSKLYRRPPTSYKHHQQNGWIQNLLKKKSVALSYMNSKQTDKEIRETTTFSLSTNIIKYLGVTLTKKVKVQYYKNLKSMMKWIEENIRPQKFFPYSWIGKNNIVKIAGLPKRNLQIQCNPHQNSNTLLNRPWKSNSQLHMKK